jgi:hypothetical protein
LISPTKAPKAKAIISRTPHSRQAYGPKLESPFSAPSVIPLKTILYPSLSVFIRFICGLTESFRLRSA